MIFYVTRYSLKELSKSFINLRFLRFIDTKKILEKYKDVERTNEVIFLINKEINDSIIDAQKLKRYNGIVYSNKNLNKDVIQNILKLIDRKLVTKIIFIDKENENPDECQTYFTDILYFIDGKRKHILKCTPIKKQNDYKK